MRILIAVALAGVSIGCASVKPTTGPGRAFDFKQDTFAYANELVFNYENGVHTASTNLLQQEHSYTRRCFIMAAGVIQFWKHARFDPQAAPVSDEELAERIRELRDRAAWWPSEPTDQRVVFPGFASLRDLSEHKGLLLRANMGAGWTTYFHWRKFPMPFEPSPAAEADLEQTIEDWLAGGHPMAVWLYNFPHVNINHAVTIFEKADSTSTNQIIFHVYDPNFTDRPRTLTYDRDTKSFSYEKTFYFPGGPVHVRRMYTGLLH